MRNTKRALYQLSVLLMVAAIMSCAGDSEKETGSDWGTLTWNEGNWQ